jgi:dGTPase
MDLSDDIAYSVHDFEDAVVAGFIDVAALGDRVGENDIVSAMHAWVGDDLSRDELLEAFDRLRAMSQWMTSYDGSRQAQARLKNLTSQLIGRFARTATTATREAYASGSLVRFAASVVTPPEIIGEIAVLKGIVAAFVMTQGDRQPVYEDQRRVLTELLDTLADRGADALEPGFAADWRAASDDAGRRRAVVDQVANLTDQGALAWHRRLVVGEREPAHIAV